MVFIINSIFTIVLTVILCEFNIMSFAGVERKFFEKGIRRDKKPVPI